MSREVISFPNSTKNDGISSSAITAKSFPKRSFPCTSHPFSKTAKAGFGPSGVCLTPPRKPREAIWWAEQEEGQPEIWICGSTWPAKPSLRTASTQFLKSFWESLAPTWQMEAPMQATEDSNTVCALSFVISSIFSASWAARLMM